MSGKKKKPGKDYSKQLNELRFTGLMHENMDFAYHIAKQFIKQPTDIQDAIQTAFIKAWKAFDQYHPEKSRFTTWFYSIIKNECIDRIRSDKSNLNTTLDKADLKAVVEDEHAGDTMGLYQTIILEAEYLPAAQKETFILRDIEGYTIREVREITGQTQGSIKTNLYLARKKIRGGLLKNNCDAKNK